MDACLVLEDFISRSRIPHIIYRIKSRSLWSSFGWSTMKKFSEVLALSIEPVQNVQREVICFPFVVRKNVSELSKYFSIHCKTREIPGPYNFLTLIKSSIPDAWKWNCWTLFRLENEVEGGGGAWPSYALSGGYGPAHTCHVIKLGKLQKHVSCHYKAWEKKLVSVCFLKKLKH